MRIPENPPPKPHLPEVFLSQISMQNSRVAILTSILAGGIYSGVGFAK
jgi:hypothetical protein